MDLEQQTQTLIALCRADKEVMGALADIEKTRMKAAKNWQKKADYYYQHQHHYNNQHLKAQALANRNKVKYHTARRLQGKPSKLAGSDKVTIRDLFNMLGGV